MSPLCRGEFSGESAEAVTPSTWHQVLAMGVGREIEAESQAQFDSDDED